MADSLLYVRRWSLPLRSPLVTARGTIAVRDVFVVRLRGARAGVGEASPLPGAGTESADDCAAALAAASAWTAIPEEPRAWASWLEARLPDAPAARFGLDLALWDAHARRLGLPLAAALRAYLGAEAPPAPPGTTGAGPRANALLGGPTADLGARAAAAVAAGFGWAKLKVAARPREDLARVRAVRAAAPGLRLRLDANGGWADAEAAEAAARPLLAEAGPGVQIEQPVPRRDVAGLAAFVRAVAEPLNAWPGRGPDAQLVARAAAGAPAEAASARTSQDAVVVAADESVRTRADGRACLAAGVGLVLKPMRLGGLLVTLELAALASAAGRSAWLTTTLDGAIATAATAHLAAAADPHGRYAHGLATSSLLQRDVGPPLPVVGGTLPLPDLPGHGVAPFPVSARANDPDGAP